MKRTRAEWDAMQHEMLAARPAREKMADGFRAIVVCLIWLPLLVVGASIIPAHGIDAWPIILWTFLACFGGNVLLEYYLDVRS